MKGIKIAKGTLCNECDIFPYRAIEQCADPSLGHFF